MATEMKYEYRVYDGNVLRKPEENMGVRRYNKVSKEWEEIEVDGPSEYDSDVGWWMFASPLTEAEANKLMSSKD